MLKLISFILCILLISTAFYGLEMYKILIMMKNKSERKAQTNTLIMKFLLDESLQPKYDQIKLVVFSTLVVSIVFFLLTLIMMATS